jgi:hypothetical protein
MALFRATLLLFVIGEKMRKDNLSYDPVFIILFSPL